MKINVFVNATARLVADLKDGPVTIGRGPDNSLTLPEPGLSRTHAKFELIDEQVHISDLDSKNGTYIYDARVQEPIKIAAHVPVELADGSVLVWYEPCDVDAGSGDADPHIEAAVTRLISREAVLAPDETSETTHPLPGVPDEEEDTSVDPTADETEIEGPQLAEASTWRPDDLKQDQHKFGKRSGGIGLAPRAFNMVEADMASVKVDLAAVRTDIESVLTNLTFDAKIKLDKPYIAPLYDVITDDTVAAVPDFSAIAAMTNDEVKEAMISFLLMAEERGASDVHLCSGARPFLRVNKEMVYLSEKPLEHIAARRLNSAFLNDGQRQYLEEAMDYEFALALDDHRYRVTIMYQKEGFAGTFRIVPAKIRTLEELGFLNAKNIKKLLNYHNGIILIAGPVGSGKTTTLGALVDEINRTRRDHIITIEDPIEIIQLNKSCMITQREVGVHTKSFSSALTGALREDPDVIVIGELRDLETIKLAITAAETGHLVIGTLHTADAATTLNLILDVFPPAQRSQIRAMISESLRGVLCQRLLPTVDGKMTVACELLLGNLAVSNLIRENKMFAMRDVMLTNTAHGMVLMDFYITDLWERGIITEETARKEIEDHRIFDERKKEQILQPIAAEKPQTKKK